MSPISWRRGVTRSVSDLIGLADQAAEGRVGCLSKLIGGTDQLRPGVARRVSDLIGLADHATGDRVTRFPT